MVSETKTGSHEFHAWSVQGACMEHAWGIHMVFMDHVVCIFGLITALQCPITHMIMHLVKIVILLGGGHLKAFSLVFTANILKYLKTDWVNEHTRILAHAFITPLAFGFLSLAFGGKFSHKLYHIWQN